MITEEEHIRAILADDFWVTDHVTASAPTRYGTQTLYKELHQYLTNQDMRFHSFHQDSYVDGWVLDRVTYITITRDTYPITETYVLRQILNNTAEVWLGLDSMETIDMPQTMKRRIGDIKSTWYPI